MKTISYLNINEIIIIDGNCNVIGISNALIISFEKGKLIYIGIIEVIIIICKHINISIILLKLSIILYYLLTSFLMPRLGLIVRLFLQVKPQKQDQLTLI